MSDIINVIRTERGTYDLTEDLLKADQNTDLWALARCGRVTASRIGDILAKVKSGPSASRKNYLAELVAERLSGQPAEHFESKPMKWGHEYEGLAGGVYEAYRGVMVTTCGFIPHPLIDDCGGSPDGLVGDEGLIEIKCPNTATHIATLRRGKFDPQYFEQMQWDMVCAERVWCDFVSYDPRLPDPMSLFVDRVPLDVAWIAETNREVINFLREVDATVRELKERFAA